MNFSDVALIYLQHGWSIIPLKGKRPLIPWRIYQSRRPTEEEVYEWGERWPETGIGIVCGRVSGGLDVLDIDDPDLASQLIESNIGATRLAKTPSGGLHIYVQEQHDSRSGPLVSGVADLKAEGGYVVAPPSPGYKLLSDVAPVQVVDAREWAIGCLQAHGVQISGSQSSQQKVRAYEALKHRSLKKGERNEALLSLGGLLWHKGFPSEVIEAALVGVNQSLCYPPLPVQGTEGVQKIVRSVSSYPRNSISPPPIYTNGEVELQPVALVSLEEPSERAQIVQGFIPQGCPALLYGDGGQGKSLLALAVATCVATGKPFLNLSVRQTKVLYLDWELDQEEQTRRAYKVARGLGFNRIPEGLLYLRMEESVSDLLESIRRIISQHNIGLVVIDSLGPACGGDPEQAKFIIPLMNDFRKLNTTLLVIDHQAKLQEGQNYSRKTPFGSAYKFNLARSVLQLQRVDTSKDRTRSVLRHTKSNLGPLQEPVPIQLIFEPGKIRVELADPTDLAFTVKLKAGEKIERSLKDTGPGTAAELSNRTGFAEGTVTNALTELKNEGTVIIHGKQGRAPIYALTNSLSPPGNNTDGEMEKGLQSDGPR